MYSSAKIHCVADADCINTPKDIACLPFSIIPRDTEFTIRDAIRGQDEEFIQEMVEFGMVISLSKNFLIISCTFRSMVNKYDEIIDCFSKHFVIIKFLVFEKYPMMFFLSFIRRFLSTYTL